MLKNTKWGCKYFANGEVWVNVATRNSFPVITNLCHWACQPYRWLLQHSLYFLLRTKSAYSLAMLETKHLIMDTYYTNSKAVMQLTTKARLQYCDQ